MQESAKRKKASLQRTLTHSKSEQKRANFFLLELISNNF